MTNEEIKELALKHSFTLRPTAENGPDLRPYVYGFARALVAAEREACAITCEVHAATVQSPNSGTPWSASHECAAKIRGRS